ncbi:MAG: type II toxin-antitoxin system HipA family toxin [Longimicrobiales bacterium]
MNGIRVGSWEQPKGGAVRLRYDPSWIASAQGRPLSLSLPLTPEPAALSSQAVSAYFDNLIPDNEAILRRLRERFHARSISSFDLLAMVGRDCAGALQIVPANEKPGDTRVIEAEVLSEAGVARLLRGASRGERFGSMDQDAFRLSLAGAQEKTALLRHGGKWCLPRGATPSTHIFKLPLGVIGNRGHDYRESIENEWVCLELMRELGHDVARAEIAQFEDQRTLVVERFDRRLSTSGKFWLRVPQEDFCQVFALPPSRKYESEGGPGIASIVKKLRSSERGATDVFRFFEAQIVFWLLAATDGHAKNFSIELLAGGRYRSTPLYDVISAYPIMGRRNDQLDPRKARLAMAAVGKSPHYRLHEIHRWHWNEMSRQLRIAPPAGTRSILERMPTALDRVASKLPPAFPAHVFESIDRGVRAALLNLAREPDVQGGRK